MEQINKNYQRTINFIVKNQLIDGATHDNYMWVGNNVSALLALAESKRSLETKKVWALSCGKLLKVLGQEDVAKPFYTYVVKLNGLIRDAAEDQTLNDRQFNNYVDFDTICRKRDQLGRWFKKNPGDHGLNLTYLIMCLYTYQEPLRDNYHAVRIYNHNDDVSNPETVNYLVRCDTGKHIFYLNHDKMSHKKEAQSFKWSKKLSSIVDESLKCFPRDYLIVSQDMKPLKIQRIKYMISKIFEKEGRRMNIFNFRSAYITNFYSNPKHTIKDKNKLAHNMRNGRIGAEAFYQKIMKSNDDKSKIHIDKLSTTMPRFKLIKHRAVSPE